MTLAYKKLGIAPIVMSAGELESGNAGEPAKLIRQRYREASDIIKKGKMCSLFINDLDAGARLFLTLCVHCYLSAVPGSAVELLLVLAFASA